MNNYSKTWIIKITVPTIIPSTPWNSSIQKFRKATFSKSSIKLITEHPLTCGKTMKKKCKTIKIAPKIEKCSN